MATVGSAQAVVANSLQNLDTFHIKKDKAFLASFNDTKVVNSDTNVSSRTFAMENYLPSSSSISCMEKSKEAAWYINAIGRVPNTTTCIVDKVSN